MLPCQAGARHLHGRGPLGVAPAAQARRGAGAAMSRPTPALEIAANSLASAHAAQAGGATRIELCSALELGGLTPSHAQIALVREEVSLPVHVLVRPRAGDFVYSDAEHRSMLADIAHCVAAGCDGVVVGALDAQGHVDRERCRALVDAAGPLTLTFHRAIDVCADPLRALDDIIALGFHRVLSSGGATDAVTGADTLRAMVDRAGDALIVMPGAGITPGNLAMLAACTRAHEFHASASRLLPSAMPVRSGAPAGMAEGERRSCEATVRALASVVATLVPA